ncbi:hypothetical protein AB1Y20_001744 [Prymnesium parvum]|uniref:DUF155 domain-containing protein n=1 Tax=Prymnesium parvum TaxID=97485 RepID=A0AB34K8N4_PRYPA
MRSFSVAVCRMLPLRRALSEAARPAEASPLRHASVLPRRMLLPRKKLKSPLRHGESNDYSHRICAHMMGHVHTTEELAASLRSQFGAGAVTVFGSSHGYMDEMDDTREIEDVIHLNAPASGANARHGSPTTSVFFFSSEAAPCVSVWWGADPAFEQSMLSHLLAQRPRIKSSKEELAQRLAVPKVTLKWHGGSHSELSGDEVLIDMTASPRARVLDQLAFSAALHRHMKVLLLEDEVEHILSSVKQIVREGLGASFISRLLRGRLLGHTNSGVSTMQRLLLAREFNFDSDVMSTPDWLWEQPEREAMYDAVVAEYEIVDRIEAINQQLDYAQATMQSLKEDKQFQHSTFLEYTIVFLIAFEVAVEMHAAGWIDWRLWWYRLAGKSAPDESSS